MNSSTKITLFAGFMSAVCLTKPSEARIIHIADHQDSISGTLRKDSLSKREKKFLSDMEKCLDSPLIKKSKKEEEKKAKKEQNRELNTGARKGI